MTDVEHAWFQRRRVRIVYPGATLPLLTIDILPFKRGPLYRFCLPVGIRLGYFQPSSFVEHIIWVSSWYLFYAYQAVRSDLA
jgi:hypothetical protein